MMNPILLLLWLVFHLTLLRSLGVSIDAHCVSFPPMLCCQYNTFYIIFSETLSPSLRVSGEGVSTEQNFSRVGDVIGAIPADPEHVRQRPDVHAGIGIRPLHGKRLTGVRLPVSEYANVVPARKRHAERTFFRQKHATMKKCKHTHTQRTRFRPAGGCVRFETA